mmetsp:Transcript_102753/g.326601  ORF Transcript_102753/g.326601 Transcript_102753/m.326601 type:complete len:215 (+) Transcript_102753:2049-2693(+)
MQHGGLLIHDHSLQLLVPDLLCQVLCVEEIIERLRLLWAATLSSKGLGDRKEHCRLATLVARLGEDGELVLHFGLGASQELLRSLCVPCGLRGDSLHARRVHHQALGIGQASGIVDLLENPDGILRGAQSFVRDLIIEVALSYGEEHGSLALLLGRGTVIGRTGVLAPEVVRDQVGLGGHAGQGHLTSRLHGGAGGGEGARGLEWDWWHNPQEP